MDNWKLKKLNEFIIFNPKESIKRGTLAKQILMENLEPYNKYLRGFKYTEFKGGSRFKNGDTLLVRLALCLDNGKTAKVTILDDDETAFGSTEFIVLRKIEEVSDEDFIYYLSISPRLREIAIKSSIGATRERVNQNALENFEINLPPLEEQKAIANILSCLDEKIELNNKINKNLEEILQTIFKRWYIDFEYPLTEEEITNGGREFVNSELGKIPKGWSIGNLGESSITNIVKSGVDDFVGEKIYLSTVDVEDTNIMNTSKKITSKEKPSRANIQPKPKTVYFTKMKDSRKVIGVDDYTDDLINNYIFSTNFSGIECCNNSLYYIWTYLLTNKFDTTKNNLCCGTSSQAINNENINKINILIPTAEILKLFEHISLPIFEKWYRNNKENEKLKQIRDILLPKLINGDIRVPY